MKARRLEFLEFVGQEKCLKDGTSADAPAHGPTYPKGGQLEIYPRFRFGRSEKMSDSSLFIF